MPKNPTSKDRQEAYDNFIKEVYRLIQDLNKKKIMNDETTETWLFYISVMARYIVK